MEMINFAKLISEAETRCLIAGTNEQEIIKIILVEPNIRKFNYLM